MSSFTEKVEEKLHIGGHKKEEGAHPYYTDPAYAGVGAHPYYTDPAYAAVPPGHAGAATSIPVARVHGQVPHQSRLDQVKNKVKGGKKKGGGGSSSSSSESDGEGGRRKKKFGIF